MRGERLVHLQLTPFVDGFWLSGQHRAMGRTGFCPSVQPWLAVRLFVRLSGGAGSPARKCRGLPGPEVKAAGLR